MINVSTISAKGTYTDIRTKHNKAWKEIVRLLLTLENIIGDINR